MAMFVEPLEVLALLMTVLLLFLKSHEALDVANYANNDNADSGDEDLMGEQGYVTGWRDCSALAALHHVRILSGFLVVGGGFGILDHATFPN